MAVSRTALPPRVLAAVPLHASLVGHRAVLALALLDAPRQANPRLQRLARVAAAAADRVRRLHRALHNLVAAGACKIVNKKFYIL